MLLLPGCSGADQGSEIDELAGFVKVNDGGDEAPCRYVEGQGPEMVLIEPGYFLMGSPEDEPGRGNDEHQHGVAIARSFAISRCEVTFDEYEAFAKASGRESPIDESWGRGNRPVINVSWEDAQAYVAWLRECTGRPYRLPTEAEWEYAGRAGTSTPFWTGACLPTSKENYRGDDPLDECPDGESRDRTMEVGSLAPNPWGLYDMHGNVTEWVEDTYHETYEGAPLDGGAWEKGGVADTRVLRGGSWGVNAGSARSADRGGITPGDAGDNVGFRVVLDLARTR